MGTPLAPCRNLIGLNEDRGDPNGKLTAGWSKPIAQLNENCRLQSTWVTCSPKFRPLISWVHPLEMDDAAQPIH